MGNVLRVSRLLFVGVLATVFSAIGVAQESEGGGLRTVEETFRDNCAVCHMDSGEGNPPTFPSLNGNEQLGDLFRKSKNGIPLLTKFCVIYKSLVIGVKYH